MKKFWLLTILVPLATASCASVDSSENDGGDESEPAASEDALKSAVSCNEKAVTGYNAGSPYAMKVITVGDKATAKNTAHAFLKMQAAADKAGVTLSISSGFRTMAEQQHLYSCYVNHSCNGGNLAAKPGYSNHQNGRALDLGTSNWTWVANNASKFGFKRTVPSERWHYEFFGNDPGGPCAGGTDAPLQPTPGAPITPGTSNPPSNPSNPSNPEAPGNSGTPGTPPGSDPSGDDPLPAPLPVPVTPPADPAPAGGCYSPTVGKTMPQGSCVQSSADDVMYQCHETLWYRGVTNGKGPYGNCTSITSH